MFEHLDDPTPPDGLDRLPTVRAAADGAAPRRPSARRRVSALAVALAVLGVGALAAVSTHRGSRVPAASSDAGGGGYVVRGAGPAEPTVPGCRPRSDRDAVADGPYRLWLAGVRYDALPALPVGTGAGTVGEPMAVVRCGGSGPAAGGGRDLPGSLPDGTPLYPVPGRSPGDLLAAVAPGDPAAQVRVFLRYGAPAPPIPPSGPLRPAAP